MCIASTGRDCAPTSLVAFSPLSGSSIAFDVKFYDVSVCVIYDAYCATNKNKIENIVTLLQCRMPNVLVKTTHARTHAHAGDPGIPLNPLQPLTCAMTLNAFIYHGW